MNSDIKNYIDKCDDLELQLISNYIKEKIIISDIKKPISYEKYVSYKLQNMEKNNVLNFTKIKNDLENNYTIKIGNIILKGKLLPANNKNKHDYYYKYSDNKSMLLSHLGGINTIEEDFKEINLRNTLNFEVEVLKRIILQKIILLNLLIKAM